MSDKTSINQDMYRFEQVLQTYLGFDDSAPTDYEQLSYKYLRVRREIKRVKQRVDVHHLKNDQLYLMDLRALSRNLARARHAHPDRERQLSLF